jgi:hypothetical protein
MAILYDASGNPFLTDVRQVAQGLSALNAANTVALFGQSTVVVQITAIGTQTISFEASADNGTTYFSVTGAVPGPGGSTASSTTAAGQWIFNTAGYTHFRARCSAFTSGTATTSVNASQGTNDLFLTVGNQIASTTAGQIGPIVQGAVTTAAPTYTTAQTDPLSLTTLGSLRVDLASVVATALVTAAAGVAKVGISGATAVALDSASGATMPTNLLGISARAQNANPTAVTNGQAVALATDLGGRLITTPYAYRTLIKHQATTLAATTETTIITAGGASVFNDLLCLIITTAGAAVATFTIRDVTAGGTPFILDYPNAAVAPGAPLIIPFPAPLQQGTANSAWTVTCSVATTAHITAQYVQRIA